MSPKIAKDIYDSSAIVLSVFTLLQCLNQPLYPTLLSVEFFLPMMARHKQTAPLRREPSNFENLHAEETNGKPKHPYDEKVRKEVPQLATADSQAGLTQLVVCVAGIYASL